MLSIADLIAKATIALLLVGLVAVVLSQTLEERVLIHPILVPESLSKRGYADAIVAIRLQDEINSILREVREIPTLEMADRTAEPALIRFEPPDSLSATVPGSTISLKWLLAHVRSVVAKQDQTVGGEIVTTDSGELTCRLRINVSSNQKLYDIQSSRIDDLMKDAAEKYLATVCAPVMASLHNKRGVELAKMNKFQEAIAEYKKAIGMLIYEKYEVDLASIYANWGLALARLRESAAAIEKFEEALEIKPDAAYAYVSWGQVLRSWGQRDQAIAMFEKALVADGRYAYAYVAWGEILAAEGNSGEATTKFEKAIELNRNYDYPYVAWGTLLLDKLNRPAEAKAKFKQAINVNPAHTQAHVLLGRSLAQLGKTDDAVRQFREAVRINPSYDYAYDAWGELLLESNKPALAAAKFQEAVKVNPEYDHAWVAWGEALAELGELDKAIAKFERALAVRQGYDYAYVAWGKLLLDKRGDPAAAATKLQKALARSPNHVEAQRLLDRALAALQDRDRQASN